MAAISIYLKIIRKSLYKLRDSYIIYVLASVFAVAVLTLLAMLVVDPTLKTSHYWNISFQQVMYAMVFIFAFFTFVYMAYVGGFFIEQQKNEFRTYFKLGMSKFTIALISFLETFVVQLISWIIGMLVALILQKFVGMLLVYLMRIDLTFKFYYSAKVVWIMLQVGLYSTLILSLFNGLRSYFLVRDKHKKKHLYNHWLVRSLLGVLGLLLFLTGVILTLQLLTMGRNYDTLDQSLVMTLVIAILYLFGSYLVFKGFLPLVLEILDRLKIFSYRGTNLFTFKYLHKRLVKNTSIIWFITELSALAVAVLVFCYAGYQVVYQDYQNSYSFELAANKSQAQEVEKQLTKQKTHVKGRYHTPIKRTVSEVWDYSENAYVPRLVSVMSNSDYQKLPQRLTKKNPPLKSGDFLEVKSELSALTPNYNDTRHPIQVKNMPKIATRKVGSMFPYGNRMYSCYMLIVPDEYYHQIDSEASDTFYGWDVSGADHFSNAVIKKLQQKKHRYYLTVNIGSSLDKSTITKTKATKLAYGEYLKTNQYVQMSFVRQAVTKNVVRQATGFFLFLITIFSISLLIALGSLLTLKVLLRDDFEWRQLKTLKKIGASEKEIKQIVKRETSLLFGLPMIFALIQSFLIVGVLNLSLNTPKVGAFVLIGLSYVVLYGLTGVLTYVLSWRGVADKL
ncbi:ABC transporter permease family protein [Companilactobacillus zhongbaensis]|uniref:hypothetical protein n=1 Tax=Companilactobacillus zhongbaensis TaxID=2486009 RepID=UPI000F771C73|nr:hypothetical protein [Companilactobacillus zhongbaensis]